MTTILPGNAVGRRPVHLPGCKKFHGNRFGCISHLFRFIFLGHLKQHQTTVSQHNTSVHYNWHCYLITKHDTVFIFTTQFIHEADADAITTILSNFIARSTGESQRADRRRSIRLTASCPVLPYFGYP